MITLLVAAVTAPVPSAKWRKHDINARSPFEAAGAADFNGDGKIDIVSGDTWYEAPKWKRHKVRDVARLNPLYSEDFGDMPFDVNGDGKLDLVTCTYFGKMIGWVEHPGDLSKPWTLHEVDKPGPSEACALVDVNGDGKLDLLPNTVNQIVWYELPSWEKHVVSKEGAGHGVGIGDIDGDGRQDLIGPHGWFQQHEGGTWTFHKEFELGGASILILARDVDGDRLTDLIWGMAHRYGFFWMKQTRDNGVRGWAPKESIDDKLSEAHTTKWVDLDGKGEPALVTGKRIYAHEVEPGATDGPVIYALRFDRKKGVWNKEMIYQGEPAKNAPPTAKERDALEDFPPGTAGAGLHIEAVDIDKDGDMDLVCPGKSGLYLFENLRKRKR